MSAREGESQNIDVTPMVFILSAAAGFLGLALATAIGAWLPSWLLLLPGIGLVSMFLPSLLSLVVWRRYCRRVGASAKAARIGLTAFGAAASWPACLVGGVLLGTIAFSANHDSAQLDEAVGEMQVLVSFILGGCVALVLSWFLSRRIARAVWGSPRCGWAAEQVDEAAGSSRRRPR